MEHLSQIGIGNEGREIYWNAYNFEPWLFFFTAIALAIFAYGLYRRWKMWKAIGKEKICWDQIPLRLKSLLMNGLLQIKTWRDIYPGVMHGLIFFGFFALIIGTILVAGEFHLTVPLFNWQFLLGNFYLGFSFVMDLFGLFVLIGVLMAAFRRYVQKPQRLNYKEKSDTTADDAIALLLIAVIIITGFIVEGLRIYILNVLGNDYHWEIWSFVGWTVARVFPTGLDYNMAAMLHKVSWWVHAFVALGFIAYIPYSKLLHMITVPANHFFKSLEPVGSLEPIRDFETAESFGVSKLEEFTWKQIFDSDACTICGRCQDGCPAYLTGKQLSPKKLVQDIKTHWLERAAVAIKAKGMTPQKALVGEVIELQELWDCTSCMYCMEHCPASIEHLPKIIDMRRYLVLNESRFPQELQTAFQNLERNYTPWAFSHSTRADWAEGMNVPLMANARDAEILFWVGCAGAYDARYIKVTQTLARLLQIAGVRFAILGTEEKCCGDPARRAGNEYLAQTLMMENISTLNNYGIKTIVTACPHCFNIFKNEYPEFGGKYEVIHHSELIVSLIESGKIRLSGDKSSTITYHDSCYLGRYNHIYEKPRRTLKAIAGQRLIEMRRSKDRGLCCGAGGARMFMEERIGKRINIERTEEALALKPDIIGTACPYCMSMLVDGVKDKEASERVQVKDIAELVFEAVKTNHL